MKTTVRILSVALTLMLAQACGHRVSNEERVPAGAPACQTASTGTVVRHYVVSPQMDGDTITVDVWLPEGYAASGSSRYPVIYMHDGQNLFDSSTTWNHQSWEMDSVTGALIASGEIVAPVIVGVHSVNATRLGDLMPENALGYMTGERDSTLTAFLEYSKLRGNAYAAFLVKTLKPMMDSVYTLSDSRDSTFVMGSSMGGLMSIYAMSEYPDVFGGAGCLSTHWVGTLDGNPAFPSAMYAYLKDRLPRDGRHRLYLDRGTVSLDSLYGQWNDRVVALADSLGYVSVGNLATFVADSAGHEEKYWAGRVDRPLRFLLSKSEK